MKKQVQKGFWPLSAMQGIGYFQSLRNFLRNCLFFGNSLEFFWNLFEIFLNFFWNSSEGFFLEEFFWWNFFEGIFWEKFVSGIFFEGFFWEDLGGFLEGLLFLEKFFSMNYLFYFNVEGN